MSEKPLANTKGSNNKITASSPVIPQPGDPDYWPTPWTSPYGNILPANDPFLKAPEVPKAGKGWRTLAICLGIALAIFSCGLLVYLIPDGAETNRPDGEKIIEQFVRAAGRGDVDGAYLFISPALQTSYLTRDMLRTQFVERAQPLLSKYQGLTTSDKSFNDETDSNNAILVLSGQLKYSDGRSGTFRFNLEKVNGSWYIFDYRIDQPN